MKDQIKARLRRNIARVRALVSSYDSIRGTGQGRRPVQKADLLRAAVVLLHASLEDFLRSLEQWKLPSASEHVLNAVPLTGLEGRAERFFLGRLASHRGRTVDEVISLSVTEYLARSNYNDTDEIAATLTRIGITPTLASSRFPTLQELMMRRHNIVHRADENPATGTGHYSAMTISMATVESWIEAVTTFANEALAQL